MPKIANFDFFLGFFSLWGKIDLVQPVPGYRVFFASRMFISLPQNLLPQFDQFYNCISARSDCTILTAMSVFGSGFLNSSHVLLFPFSGENCVVKKRCWRLMLVTIIAVGDIVKLMTLWCWWHRDVGDIVMLVTSWCWWFRDVGDIVMLVTLWFWWVSHSEIFMSLVLALYPLTSKPPIHVNVSS